MHIRPPVILVNQLLHPEDPWVPCQWMVMVQFQYLSLKVIIVRDDRLSLILLQVVNFLGPFYGSHVFLPFFDHSLEVLIRPDYIHKEMWWQHYSVFVIPPSLIVVGPSRECICFIGFPWSVDQLDIVFGQSGDPPGHPLIYFSCISVILQIFMVHDH